MHQWQQPKTSCWYTVCLSSVTVGHTTLLLLISSTLCVATLISLFPFSLLTTLHCCRKSSNTPAMLWTLRKKVLYYDVVAISGEMTITETNYFISITKLIFWLIGNMQALCMCNVKYWLQMSSLNKKCPSYKVWRCKSTCLVYYSYHSILLKVAQCILQ